MASRNATKPAARPQEQPVANIIPLGGGFGRDLANLLFPAFLGLILAGFFLIWRFGSPPGNPNPVRALFVAISSATLSGFNTVPGIAGLNAFGQWISLCLIVGGSLFALIVGGLAVIRIVRLPIEDKDLIFAAVLAEGAALLVGTALLWDATRPVFGALYLAASSFGNCGLNVGATPAAGELPVHMIILPLTIFGGLGIPVLMELFGSILFHAPLSRYSKTVVAMTSWIYIGAVVLIILFNQAGRGAMGWSDLRTSLPQASVLAVESRTGGLPIVRIPDLTGPARWLIVVLMMIGAAPAGTAGGLKCTTLVELFAGGRKLLRGEYPGRTFAIAISWIGIYLALTFGAVLLLAYVSEPSASDDALFNAVSALSNVGFTASGLMDEKGLFFAYSAIMLVGRMAPLMVLWWMAETTADAELPIG